MTSERLKIFELQEELTRSARDELASMLGPMPPVLRRYKRRYDKDVQDYRSVTDRAHLISRIIKSHILYLGDYHTLRQSQKTLMRILKEVREERDEIFVGLEMIHEGQQEMVDRFVSGEIEEIELLEHINYWEEWGFSWRNYRQIFQYGRKHHIRLVGLDLNVRSDRRNLLARDRHAAALVARLSEAHPKALFIVFYGDFHIARPHIPRYVEQRLARGKLRRRSLICHQNAEPIYWRLLAKQKIHTTDVVRIDADSYCVMNTPPWLKYDSYINWLQVPPESRRAYQGVAVAGKKGLRRAGATTDGEAYPEVDVEFDLDDQFLTVAQQIASLLGLGEIDLTRHKLMAIFDSNLVELIERLQPSEAEARDLRARLVAFGSVHIPHHNLFYFADTSINLLAEEAAHMIRYRATRHETGPRSPREQFYAEVMTAAFGFFGSKLINYKRKCNKLDDYSHFLVSG